mgnify:FL=1
MKNEESRCSIKPDNERILNSIRCWAQTKREAAARFKSFSKKNMFAGQISYFGFFKIAWWSAIFFS